MLISLGILFERFERLGYSDEQVVEALVDYFDVY